MIRYALTIFLSAFLLFQIQPIAGKMILAWFGGSASVWSTCMVFFQTMLLLGYVYAHGLHEKLSPRKQAWVHGALLVISLAVLPISVSPTWQAGALDHPTLSVLGVLTASVGLPYFLISTPGPLLQAWYARTYAAGMPYRLYALSNLASMLALLSYPVLVEPFWTVGTQRYVWSAGYALFVVLCASTAWVAARHSASVATSAPREAEVARPPVKELLLWTLLPACASLLLLAITRHITQDVAPMPFLWIVPLSLYLLSFIICFEMPRGYHRPTFLALLAITLGTVGYALDGGFYTLTTVVVLCSSVFVFSMFCHGELVRRKPHPRHLTLFYLCLSLGGALGGMFVGLLAPIIFNAYLELPIGLALVPIIAVLVLWKSSRKLWRGALIVTACLYAGWLTSISRDFVEGYRKVVRNFYAQLRVDQVEIEGHGLKRKLFHGRITHGEQFITPALLSIPTAYYCHETGIGRLLLSLDPSEPHRLGVVGLGVGTLAAYGRAGDSIRIYEINDQVIEIAREEFTYLRDSAAAVVTVLGDARLSLEREPNQNFDVLVIDAFSGDSIPTHLLTLEAIEAYVRHLKPDGVLAVHITNNTLDLRPVMASAAARTGRVAVIDEYSRRDADWYCRTSDWVFLATQERAATLPAQERLDADPGFRPWTDDYSNLLLILK
jgi:hypothetical protein